LGPKYEFLGMELLVKTDIKGALKKYFGFDEFRGRQEEVVRHLLNLNDGLVIMPTGAGKSLCYQLPAIIMGAPPWSSPPSSPS
jgi:ATP-dependent DNA helicase RecQ